MRSRRSGSTIYRDYAVNKNGQKTAVVGSKSSGSTYYYPTLFTWDEYGNFLSWSDYGNGREHERMVMSYIYDDNGNWLQKSALRQTKPENLGENAWQDKELFLYQRTIEYY